MGDHCSRFKRLDDHESFVVSLLYTRWKNSLDVLVRQWAGSICKELYDMEKNRVVQLNSHPCTRHGPGGRTGRSPSAHTGSSCPQPPFEGCALPLDTSHHAGMQAPRVAKIAQGALHAQVGRKITAHCTVMRLIHMAKGMAMAKQY